jgi:hypothetical protein
MSIFEMPHAQVYAADRIAYKRCSLCGVVSCWGDIEYPVFTQPPRVSTLFASFLSGQSRVLSRTPAASRYCTHQSLSSNLTHLCMQTADNDIQPSRSSILAAARLSCQQGIVSGPALSRHDKVGDVEDTTSEKIYFSAVVPTPMLRPLNPSKENKTTIGDAVYLAYLHTLLATASDSLQSGRLMQG